MPEIGEVKLRLERIFPPDFIEKMTWSLYPVDVLEFFSIGFVVTK